LGTKTLAIKLFSSGMIVTGGGFGGGGGGPV